ncbi:MAG TPA: prepilin-type N-terminal cleavage/methylation domain-containing protein [Terriglobales bacterium]|nr:prepilin-type N-terminal cleavage/methylation domain-containing protein [Terriglobales bacterium]
MRRPVRNSRQRRHRASGFSLIEMMSVVAIGIVVTAVSFMTLVPVMNQQRVNNAYNITLAAMRQAHDNAMSQRTSYSVTFSNTVTPNTITVAPTLTGFAGAQSAVTYQLPNGVTFYAASALSSVTAPDSGAGASFGTGTHAIDFGYTANGVGTGGQTVVYFCPDGSAQDAEGGAGNCAGSWDDGVVYIARSTDLLSSRAISLWGATGRVRGWRLYSTGASTYQWKRQ